MMNNRKYKRNTKQIILKSILVIAFLVVVCIGVELLCNYKVLSLPSDKKGELSLLGSESEMVGFEKKDQGYVLSEDYGKITWKIDETYVDKFTYQFMTTGYLEAKDRWLETDGYLEADIQWGGINGFGKEEIQSVEDNNPILLQSSTVNIKGDKVTWISIEVTKDNSIQNEEIEIYAPAVKNKVAINEYRICSVAAVFLLLAALIIFRKIVLKKIEYGFAIVAFFTGLIMIINLPLNKVGWDEEIHLNWAYRMSVLPGNESVPTEIAGQIAGMNTVYNWPMDQPSSYEENKEWNAALNNIYANGEPSVNIEGWTAGTATPGLAFQALALKAARGIDLPYSYMIAFGRLMGLLLYTLMIFFAIKFIPVGKRILTFVSLTPTSMFIAVCYTYDILVYAGIVLGTALVLREWLQKGRVVDTKNMVSAYAIWFVSIFAKAIYAPFVLLGFFIPLKKYKNKKQRYFLWILYIAVFVALLAVFIIPVIGNDDSYTDTRHAAADSSSQISGVLTHPITYTCVLLKNIFLTLPDSVFGAGCYRAMGHLPMAGFAYLIPIVAVLLILTDQSSREDVEELTVKHRLIIFLILGLIVVLIWSALYVSFNEPGVSTIQGVQGRYYRPLLPLLYIILGSRFVKVNIAYEKYNAVLLGVCIVIMGATASNVFELFQQ